MRLQATVLLLFFFIAGFSQEIAEKRTITTTYLTIKEFKKLGNELTRQDSLNFKFHNGDTLVKMPPDFVSQKNEDKYELNYEYRQPEFLEKYKEVVFWKEGQCSRIWEKEMKMYLDPSIPQKHRKALRDFAAGLSTAVDSLTIVEVAKVEDANFHLYYTSTKDTVNYDPHLSKTKSGYYLYWNNRQRLERGFVKVDTESIKNPVYQLANLKYQFFRSLGMFSSSNQFECDSYLSNCNGIRSLTSQDMEILQYHYAYGKPHAVDKYGFEKFHTEIQEIYRKDPTAKIYISPSR